MLVFPNGYFRMIVGFGMSMFIGPLIIFGLPLGYRLAILFKIVVVIISNNESVIIESTSLYYGE